MATLFNGTTALGQTAQLSVSGADLHAQIEGADPAVPLFKSWPINQCGFSRAGEGRMTISTADGELALGKEEWEKLCTQHPELRKTVQFGETTKTILIYVGSGVVAIALLVFGFRLMAEPISRMITIEQEAKALSFLTDSAGAKKSENLEVLLKELQPEHAIQIRLSSEDIPNAFTLPGASIHVTKGLICLTQNPDEVAGVLAHELGHIERRHVLKGLISHVGLSLLMAVFIGDTSGGGLAQAWISNHFSVADERQADEDAAARLKRVGINPIHLAHFFERLEKEHAALPKYLEILFNDHPPTPARIAYFKDQSIEFEKSGEPTTPAKIATKITAKQWKYLRKEADCSTKSTPPKSN